MPEKKRDWCDKQFISISNNELHGSPFKVILLESNKASYLSLLRFIALLEGFSWNAPKLNRYGPLDVLYTFKLGPLDGPLDLGEKKKAT